jgi:hypothetical protein
MKKKSTVLTMAAVAAVIVTSILLAGCGPKPTKIIVMPGHKRQFIIDADLAVMVLDTPRVIYFGDLKKSLSFTKPPRNMPPEEVLWNYFSERFVRDIGREVDLMSVSMVEPRHDYRITREVVRTLDEDIMIQVPEVGTVFTFDDNTPALVLFMCQIRLGTETNPYSLERPDGGLNVAIARRLVYLGSFVLWDNREFKPISYGRVKTTVPIIREEATETNWDEGMRTFVRTIFEPTGFLRRKQR